MNKTQQNMKISIDSMMKATHRLSWDTYDSKSEKNKETKIETNNTCSKFDYSRSASIWKFL